MKKSSKEPKEEETLLQQILGLEAFGEYITLFVALFPAIVILAIDAKISDDESTLGVFLIELCCVVTLGWLLVLERFGRIKVTTPHIPIPIKWIIPIIMISALFESCN